MKETDRKKRKQLGMPHGTAANKLRKAIMFDLIKKAGKNICFQCGETIDNISNLSIEHKIPWLDSEDPAGLYFDLDNIAFSHLTCNCKAGRYTRKRTQHGSGRMYNHYGCRCDKCKEWNKLNGRKYRLKRRSITGSDR